MLKARSLLNTHTKTKRAPHTPSRCSYHLPSKQCMKLDPHCSAVEPLHRLRLCKKADPTSHRALPAQCLWVLPKFMQGHAMGHWNATLAPSCATSKASQIPHWKSQRSSRYSSTASLDRQKLVQHSNVSASQTAFDWSILESSSTENVYISMFFLWQTQPLAESTAFCWSWYPAIAQHILCGHFWQLLGTRLLKLHPIQLLRHPSSPRSALPLFPRHP